MKSAPWLWVSATPSESQFLSEAFAVRERGAFLEGSWRGQPMHLLHTGLGMVNTAFALGNYLAHQQPIRALQIGIAGAFPGGPELESVVQVGEEIYSDLGADSPTGFLGLEEMGFPAFSVAGRSYFNRIPNPHPALPGMPVCRGITVNTVNGEATAIGRTQQLWSPEVESMEGAPFFQACLVAGIPFHQIRAISNRVEPRNRAAWRIPQALLALEQSVMHLLNSHFP